MKPIFALAGAFALSTLPVHADPVGITAEMMEATVPTSDGGTATISRVQDNDAVLSGDWAKTARACPPFCIQPNAPVEGVTTIGELELIEMLQDPEAIVVDSRTAEWFQRGSIPGAIHLPYTQVVDRLAELGCEAGFDGWECDGASKVALFCNGMWCGQSPTAIRAMVAEGYPVEKIFYYRGGMQSWNLLGLTVTEPK